MNTIQVKTLTGEIFSVEIPAESRWRTEAIKYAIEQIDSNFPRYLQVLQKLEEENEKDLLPEYGVTLRIPDVYLQHQTIYSSSKDDVRVDHYSIIVVLENLRRAQYHFVKGPKGFHHFTQAEIQSRTQYIDYVFKPDFLYVETIEEALASLPDAIHDLALSKWHANEIVYGLLPHEQTDSEEAF